VDDTRTNAAIDAYAKGESLMCGIMGYVGRQAATPLVLDGLQQLEYRGYDSAGIAVIGTDGQLHVRRAAGKLINLRDAVARAPVTGHVGVGHTRWATHGPPIDRNAHPHSSRDGALAVVQNGIVENYDELRARLGALGYTFASDTDTETIVHLLHFHYHNELSSHGISHNGRSRNGHGEWTTGQDSHDQLVAAVRATLRELQGPSAIVVISRAHPDQLIAARVGNAGGVAIGIGDNEYMVASDLPAIVTHARNVIYLESGELAVVRPDGVTCSTLSGVPVSRPAIEIAWSPEAVERGPYVHFMQKEIYEQAQSLTDTLRGRLDVANQTVTLDDLGLDADWVAKMARVVIVACGTSYYAGLLGKHYLERLARVPVEVDYASEFRYRDPVLSPQTLVVAITQSGETADTLAALEEARGQGARTVAIVNVAGSQAARVCDGVIPMQAGPEIGVASTKAFTSSLVCLLMLGMQLEEMKRSSCHGPALVRALATLPGLAGELLSHARQTGFYTRLAEEYARFENFLYIGRGLHYAIAREGALKLKEISYIHAEGYPAGEMKHGPIALIDPTLPTVALCPQDSVYEKMISQVEQVKARGGLVLAVGHADDDRLAALADVVIPMPRAHEFLLPILATLPMQLFAYEMALARGADVDQPRNLAKSVTVE
jgi:glutamine---fructose-6-phosphate transaminase (isomerizing)